MLDDNYRECDGNPEECSACMEGFKHRDHLCQMQCQHVFHHKCLNHYLDQGQPGTQGCRVNILSRCRHHATATHQEQDGAFVSTFSMERCAGGQPATGLLPRAGGSSIWHTSAVGRPWSLDKRRRKEENG